MANAIIGVKKSVSGQPYTGKISLKMHSMFGNRYVCESTFSTMKYSKSNLKTEIECQTNNWTIVFDLHH